MSEQATQHTPGPWKVDGASEGKSLVWTAPHGDHPVAHVGPWTVSGHGNKAEREANARLIAAAPETAAERDRLRELCGELVERLLAYVKFEEHAAPASSSPMREKARAAIARAREMGVGRIS